MLPVIAIVGRPNVGKSTLFNRLTKSRAAIVCDMPGMTRDRQYGTGSFAGKNFIAIDTGGIAGGIGSAESELEVLTAEQSWLAVAEANVIFFLVDARMGFSVDDGHIADKLRKLGKKIYCVANKVDGLDLRTILADFYALGLGNVYPIAAAHGHGVRELMLAALEDAAMPMDESSANAECIEREESIKIAFVGRPNVGKSTLMNRMLGEERVVVADLPGTTRDSIFVDFTRHGTKYTLIDTAGIRRRTHVTAVEEKFSVVKALQSVEATNVVVMMFDARENITDQDLRLLGFVLECGKALVIVINKWDGLDIDQRDKIKRELDRRLTFIDFAAIKFISALHGTGVGNLYTEIKKAYLSATRKLKTSDVARVLESAVNAYPPPLVNGRRIKLRYAHIGGHNPPVIVVHGNQTEKVPASYVRYLEHYFRKALKLSGTPIRIELKSSVNPYAERK